MKNISGRLILAIISTILEESAIFVIVRWGLPQLGVNIPLAGLIALMVAWAVYAVVTYRMGTRALKREPVLSLPHMVGSKGVVVSSLSPEGMVRIRGELWIARTEDGELEVGKEVMVVKQDRLKLVVRERSAIDNPEETK